MFRDEEAPVEACAGEGISLPAELVWRNGGLGPLAGTSELALGRNLPESDIPRRGEGEARSNVMVGLAGEAVIVD
jgi:hypothetical protein